MLEKKILAAAHVDSFPIGALLLRKIGGIQITGRGLNKTAVKIGTELVHQRDARSFLRRIEPSVVELLRTMEERRMLTLAVAPEAKLPTEALAPEEAL